jgi:stalled ribosome alternative rescue factor ArfA
LISENRREKGEYKRRMKREKSREFKLVYSCHALSD